MQYPFNIFVIFYTPSILNSFPVGCAGFILQLISVSYSQKTGVFHPGSIHLNLYEFIFLSASRNAEITGTIRSPQKKLLIPCIRSNGSPAMIQEIIP